ncbi:MAG: pectate lyase, partial [Candidatus Latescibacterota bacterium]
MKCRARFLLGMALLCMMGTTVAADEALKTQAKETMVKATQFFRSQVATEGGYLWAYKPDFSYRQGENPASETTIWIQPPGTPSVGMVY